MSVLDIENEKEANHEVRSADINHILSSKSLIQPKKSSKQFNELLIAQKKMEEERRRRRQEMEQKKMLRIQSRKERNKLMQKVTKKGQPLMRHRIKLLLNELVNKKS
ncbi:hypothetical protein D915_005505 [Fasciola hepatica]|uniref:rRNA-processing protein FYV7 n=1 Tax=Fasciola hepatica TaxID=6192 RepID=A0A4E0RYF0_FASHE|nr:hypothetical protein D915_005505 [Fasciola hepatica]